MQVLVNIIGTMDQVKQTLQLEVERHLEHGEQWDIVMQMMELTIQRLFSSEYLNEQQQQ